MLASRLFFPVRLVSGLDCAGLLFGKSVVPPPSRPPMECSLANPPPFCQPGWRVNCMGSELLHWHLCVCVHILVEEGSTPAGLNGCRMCGYQKIKLRSFPTAASACSLQGTKSTAGVKINASLLLAVGRASI